MTENKNEAAFPVHADTISRCGLTKREYFAGLALQGLMAVNIKGEFDTAEDCLTEAARLSVIAADALLAELSKS